MAKDIRGAEMDGNGPAYPRERDWDDEITTGGCSDQITKYITSPIYYVNGRPHLGHFYTSTAVDICSRFSSMLGELVFTSFGVDEHGQKIETTASLHGMTPEEYVDQAHKPFLLLLNEAQIKPGCFIRTTGTKHKKTALSLWKLLEEANLIYEGEYTGWYSRNDEAFYKEAEVVNGISIVTGSPVEWLVEKCLFFRLSQFRNSLLEYYAENPNVIYPKTRFNEVMGMLKDRLPDLAISRSRSSWGIQVRDNQYMYVWLDALSNYLTGVGYPGNPYYKAWFNNTTHIIGKDILKFHAIYWPAFLLAANLPLPKRIFAHGWWQVEGNKMSKSVGNVVDPFELVAEYGADAVRYYLFRSTTFGQDGSFDINELKSIYNTELVNELGNLVQRVLMLCWDKFGTTLSGNDPELSRKWDLALEQAKKSMETCEITEYLHAARAVVIETNRYIDQQKPWINPTEEVLGSLCLAIHRIAILYYPIIPGKVEQIAKMIGLRGFTIKDSWNGHTPFPLVDKPVGIFPRLL